MEQSFTPAVPGTDTRTDAAGRMPLEGTPLEHIYEAAYAACPELFADSTAPLLSPMAKLNIASLAAAKVETSSAADPLKD